MSAEPADKLPDNISDIVWREPDGSKVSCEEKIVVLNENLEEIREICQEALEDAVLMGVAEKQIRDVLEGIVAELENPYKKG